MEEEKNYDFFISYRRDGGQCYARLIYEVLSQKFPDKTTFFDVDSMRSGDFTKQIKSEIRSLRHQRGYFIVILSPRWIDENQNNRPEENYMLEEIKWAMHFLDEKQIIPVNIMGKDFSYPPYFDEDELLKSFKGVHCFPLDMGENYGSTIKRILDELETEPKASESPTEDYSVEELNDKMSECAAPLGDVYYYGKEGQEKNMEKAESFFRAGAYAGDPYAQYSYGYLLAHDKDKSEENSRLAIEWLEKSASQNYANAMCELGQIYYRGKIVEQDYDKSNKWYEKGKKEGHADCIKYLGLNYFYGHGYKENPEKAHKLFQLALEKTEEIAKNETSEDIKKLLETEIDRIRWYITRAEKQIPEKH